MVGKASLQFVGLRNAAGQKQKHKLSLACFPVQYTQVFQLKIPCLIASCSLSHHPFYLVRSSNYLPANRHHGYAGHSRRSVIQPQYFTIYGLCLSDSNLQLACSNTIPLTHSIVLWAQRSSTSDAEKNYVFLTISVPDVSPKDLKLDLTSTGLTFTGTSESKKTTYHLDIEFYAEIDVENSKTNHSPKNIEMVLRKKELKEEYWPRLLKDKAKVHFLRTDFDKVSPLLPHLSNLPPSPPLTPSLHSGSTRTSKTKHQKTTT